MVAQAEKVGNLPSTEPAVATTTAAAPNANEFQMFRFVLEMDKETFIKKSMKLDAAQEKSLWMCTCITFLTLS